MPVRLYQHQADGIMAAGRRFAAGGYGQYLRHDPGLGKSLSAITLCKGLKFTKVGIVGPVISLGVWKREIQQWWPEAGGAIVRNNEGVSWEGDACQFLITNYDQLRDNDGVRQRFLGHVRGKRREKLDLLILDEAQAVKSVSSGTTKTIRQIKRYFRHVLFLSGTPAHNALDFYSPAKLMETGDPYWEDQTFTEYKGLVANLHGPNNDWVKNFKPDEVTEAARHFLPYCHVATSDLLKLPEPIWTPVTFKLGEEERRAYREMDKNLELPFTDGRFANADLVITKLLRLHQITGGHVTVDDGTHRPVGKSKLQALRQLLVERSHQKVIIACRFRWEVDAVANLIGFREGALGPVLAGDVLPDGSFSEGKHVAIVITGDTPQAERDRLVELFQTSDRPIALVVQYRAGGISITLTAAQALIFYSFEPSVIAFRQMIGRVWRIGTTGHVQMLPLLADGTVDVKTYKGLCDGLDGVDLARYALELQDAT